MAESNKTILTLGALIIAGVALFFIGSYVGQVIKVGSSKYGTEVYTRTEIDYMMTHIKELTGTQKADILKTLNKCTIEQTQKADSGDALCIAKGKTCIASMILYPWARDSSQGVKSSFVPCNDKYGTSLNQIVGKSAICC